MLSDFVAPFERNKYFYGKLLTAADFETEQSYLNNKRRLINRLLFGTGVVCGLNVMKADDLSLVVEAGMALDYGGREIIISEPLIKTLSSLEGFKECLKSPGKDSDGNIRSIYLCVRYSENPSEPVHSIAKNALSDENDGSEFSKIQENYTLFLTCEAPEKNPCGETRNTVVLWDKYGINVTLNTPKYVKSNEKFYIETHLDKGACSQNISLEYSAELSFFTHEKEHTLTVRFTEPDVDIKDRYIIKTILTSTYPQIGVIKVTNLKVKINDAEYKTETQEVCKINISDNPEKSLLDDIRLTPMGETLAKVQNIYLAKVYLILTGEYYIIEKIAPVPFGQTVLTAAQTQALRLTENSFLPSSFTDSVKQSVSKSQPSQPAFIFKSGTINVTIPENSKKNGCYYSKPTPHFLGIGTVNITAGLSRGEEILFGNITPFDTSLIWGISLNKAQGVFTIAVKLFKPIPACELCFNWTATRQAEPPAKEEASLTLVPGISYVAVNETAIFEINRNGEKVKPEEFVWSLNTPKAGRISKNGVFTASDIPGFYEINVKSVVDLSLTAYAFIIINEVDKNSDCLL